MLARIQFLLLLAVIPAQADSTMERGLEAFRKQDFPAAEKEFLQAIRGQPSNARARKFLGMTCTAQEKFQLAGEPFRRACSLDPREENACYDLGRVHCTLNRFGESGKAFEGALKNAPENGRPLHGLALALEALGRNAEAEQRYRDAIRAGDRSAAADYGMFLFRSGRPSESIEILRKNDCKEEPEKATTALKNSPSTRLRQDPAALSFDAGPPDMMSNNGASGRKCRVETMIAGIAVFDRDNDGRLDLFVVRDVAWDPSTGLRCGIQRPGMRGYCHPQHFQSVSNSLYRNRRNGTFRDVSVESGIAGCKGKGMRIAIGDYGLDGRIDVFAGNDTVPNFLFHNEGNGRFREVGEAAPVAFNGGGRALSSMGVDSRRRRFMRAVESRNHFRGLRRLERQGCAFRTR